MEEEEDEEDKEEDKEASDGGGGGSGVKGRVVNAGKGLVVWKEQKEGSTVNDGAEGEKVEAGCVREKKGFCVFE
jgi:hypothetical protein